MFTTRIASGAFLVCKHKILLMKRGLHKQLAPGLWSAIGGHMEIEDISNIRAIDVSVTCCREVYEETGIAQSDINDLKLRYITMRKDGNEIRSIYYYFGTVNSEFPLPYCDEGELYWVDMKDIYDLPMSVSAKRALTHWIAHPDDDNIYLVISNSTGDSGNIQRL